MFDAQERLAAMSRLFGNGTMRTWGNRMVILEQCHVAMGAFRHISTMSRPPVQEHECREAYMRAGPCVPLPHIIDLEYLESAVQVLRSLGATKAYIRICAPIFKVHDANWRATVLELVTVRDDCSDGRILIAGVNPGLGEIETWENERDGVLPEWVDDLRIGDWFARMDGGRA